MDDKPSKYNDTVAGALDRIQAAIYLLVAVFLIIMALMTFLLVGRDMIQIIMEPVSVGLISTALDDLLIVLIITALIQTVMVYIKKHQLDPRLILSVGLTAMIRRILVFGAEKIAWEQVALTGLLILVLIIGIFLIGNNGIKDKQ